jgi:hypothetical protein
MTCEDGSRRVSWLAVSRIAQGIEFAGQSPACPADTKSAALDAGGLGLAASTRRETSDRGEASPPAAPADPAPGNRDPLNDRAEPAHVSGVGGRKNRKLPKSARKGCGGRAGVDRQSGSGTPAAADAAWHGEYPYVYRWNRMGRLHQQCRVIAQRARSGKLKPKLAVKP